MRNLILAIALFSAHTLAGPSFILLQDLPYTDTQEYVYKKLIRPAIMASDAAFVIHGGDMQGSKAPCSQAGLTAIRDDLYALKPDRVFVTPGDNDWTDCDRPSNPHPVSEYQVLNQLREIFYHPAPSGLAEWQLSRQEEYPENARWLVEETVFVTLHILGTVNGRAQIYLDDADFALQQVEMRDQANQIWLEQALAFAKLKQAKAMVIATHADITVGEGKPVCRADSTHQCDPYLQYRRQLRDVAKAFGKPVLFAHGDTEPMCLDKHFGGPDTVNLWRLNGAGDYNLIDALTVKVTEDPEQPFKVTALTQELTPPSCTEE
ncbi:hypothetical protein GCM10009092_18700 [Bowmanella denitrificans]|uniref:Calcineurin-like phosphoesterase domain-containing protein n=1 Tax=Bowmanella denitrificans TaxID=366582 RepID=A0ABN0X478_9ALTE|nr:hypothetical protein [Bowmanella denitrificans]